MSRPAWSVLVFGVYLLGLGVALVAAPNLLLALAGIASTSEVWIRLAGMLLLILGFFYVQAARAGFTPFFRWTLVTRLSAVAFVLAFVIWLHASPVMLLFWLGDLAGAVWTWLALREKIERG